MKKLILFLIFKVLFKPTLSQPSSMDFEHIIPPIELYFNFREIKVLTLFSCFELHENVQIYKTLLEKNFSIQIITKYDEWIYPENARTGVIADMNCEMMKSFMENSTENLYFLNHFVWMFYDFSANTNINEYFFNLDVLPISDVVVAKFSKENNSNPNDIILKYYDVYKLSMEHDPIITEISCNASTKSQVLRNLIKFGTIGKRRRDLNGMYISSGIVVSTGVINIKVNLLILIYFDWILF